MKIKTPAGPLNVLCSLTPMYEDNVHIKAIILFPCSEKDGIIKVNCHDNHTKQVKGLTLPVTCKHGSTQQELVRCVIQDFSSRINRDGTLKFYQ